MKISKGIIFAALTALMFAFSAVSCGKEVPTTQQDPEGFTVAGGTIESTEPVTTEAEPETTTEATTEAEEGGKLKRVSYEDATELHPALAAEIESAIEKSKEPVSRLTKADLDLKEPEDKSLYSGEAKNTLQIMEVLRLQIIFSSF